MGITKRRTGLENGMENELENGTLLLESSTMSSNRLLIKYIVTDHELKLNWTHFDVMCSLCVNLQCWTFPHYASTNKVLSKCELLQTYRNMHFCYTFCYKLVRRKYIILKTFFTVKSSSNPFSIPFSIQFCSPVCLLVIPNYNSTSPYCSYLQYVIL